MSCRRRLSRSWLLNSSFDQPWGMRGSGPAKEKARNETPAISHSAASFAGRCGRAGLALSSETRDLPELVQMSDDDFTRALEASREIQLTVTGRKSGREISIPVWFVLEGDKLYLVPVRGSESDWYKNVLRTPTIRLGAGEAQLPARATPISDPAKVDQILDKFRAKYGARDVQAYYPKHDAAVEVLLA